MCGKCMEQAGQSEFVVKWSTIPAAYSEIRKSRMGSLWAVSETDRLKLSSGPSSGGGVGKVFHGGRNSELVRGWVVVETRPPAKQCYAIHVPAEYLRHLGPLTKLEAEEALATAGDGAVLYLIEEVARIERVVTETRNVVWSK